ncbi:MAG: nucleoside deaminase [Hyphomonadaceae bacterium]|nr:nucleoside deaminase [Hyphomonadaceae bacterium]
MRLALEQAEAAGSRDEVPVGAVIIDAGGAVVARCGNGPVARGDATAHAEILAIREAGEKTGNYRLVGCTLYVTLEPCTMCAGAIANARLVRAVYGAPDVKGGAVDNGVRFFEQAACHHRPEVTGGVLAAESAFMLKTFFATRRG